MKVSVINQCELIGETEVSSLEQQIGKRLPDDYRSFLLSFNAQQIRPCVFPISDFSRGEKIVLHELTCLCPGLECDFQYRIAAYAGRIPRDFVPIGSDPGGNLFVLSLREEDRGAIFFWERAYEVEEDEEPLFENMYYLSPSFSVFVSKVLEE